MRAEIIAWNLRLRTIYCSASDAADDNVRVTTLYFHLVHGQERLRLAKLPVYAIGEPSRVDHESKVGSEA